MKKQRVIVVRALSAAVLVLGMSAQILMPTSTASAAQITDRKLTLVAGASDGGSKPGGTVSHEFTFTVPTGQNIKSIRFRYCTTAADVGALTCIMPTGLVTTGALLDASQTGATGFTINNTTNGDMYITNAGGVDVSASTVLGYTFHNVVNPTTTNQTFFVRISTYTVDDPITGSPAATDAGTVAASTATQIVVSGVMPESLVFCAGDTVGLTVAGVPDCTTAGPGQIYFDKLFSPNEPASTTSQMSASTNAGQGYIISVNGTTLTSGSNTISPMTASNTDSSIGQSQFGLNLVDNDVEDGTYVPNVGLDVAPTANADNYRGEAYSGYNAPGKFKFNDGNVVADSANGGAGGTDAQIYTVSYIVNVPGSQPAGTYTTTLTYICTPTF